MTGIAGSAKGESRCFLLRNFGAGGGCDEGFGHEREPEAVGEISELSLFTSERLVSSVEADTLDELVEGTKEEKEPIISSNLCEALGRFKDDGLNNALEVSVYWAPSKPLQEIASVRGPIRIQPDYFPRIEEVGRALRSAETHREAR